MKITNWKDCIRNWNEWEKLVEKAKTLKVCTAQQHKMFLSYVE
jgi:hypothetical protein